MSVHCLWRCYRVNHADRDSNVPLCRGRQEIIVCGRVSRQRWGVLGGWRAGKGWGEGQTQRKEEALGFELAGGCHNQHSLFVMVPHPPLSLQSIRTMWGRMQRRILSSCLWSSQTKTTSGFLSTEPFSGESRWVPAVWNVTMLGIIHDPHLEMMVLRNRKTPNH